MPRLFLNDAEHALVMKHREETNQHNSFIDYIIGQLNNETLRRGGPMTDQEMYEFIASLRK